MLLSFDFRRPKTIPELCRFIGITEELFEWCTNLENRVEPKYGDEDSEEPITINIGPYLKHSIPKRNRNRTGEYRDVWQVNSVIDRPYKNLARRFQLFLQEVIPGYPHPAAHGFVRGKSTLDNARLHAGSKYLVKADIKNFFPSISEDRVRDLFLEIGLHEDIVTPLSTFVTLHSFLPQGFPTSPMIANLACLKLDVDFTNLAAKYGCIYSRYADDLSFSSNEKLPSKSEISVVLDNHSFLLSESKFRKTKIGQAHFVTGLSISDPNSPHVPKRMKRKLRQSLYYAAKFGIIDHLYKIGTPDELISMGINQIDGYVRYISHVEKQSLPNLRQDWQTLMKRDGLKPSYKSYDKFTQQTAKIFADESVFEFEDKKYLALGFVSVLEPSTLGFETLRVLKDHITDPFADGNLKQLLKKVFILWTPLRT